MPRYRFAGRDSPAAEQDWQGAIERIGWGGKGLGRLDDGRMLLLDSALALFPGEVVSARIRIKSRHAEGWVTRYVSRDPRRVAAECPVAGTCGTCSLWESGAAAAELKWMMVADLLHRQLGDAPEPTWLPAPPDTRRSRIQLHWDGEQLGYHAQRTHDLVAVAGCPMAASPLSEAVRPLRDALMQGALPNAPDRWELATGTPPVEVVATAQLDPDRAWRLRAEGWQMDDTPLVHRLGGVELIQQPGAFFQVCPRWAWEAFTTVLGGWDISGITLYDLYSGSGFFSRMLGDRFRRFILVESDPASIAAARQNLRPGEAVAGRGIEIHRADVADWVPELLGLDEDVILLDPPRAGLAPIVSARLLTAGAKALILIGCDGMAFCRDVKALADVWRLDQLAAIDLFPNTPLVEFAGLLAPRR